LFDPRREHSSVPTAYLPRRRAQWPSRTALLQRRRRLVLDGREHGDTLPAIGVRLMTQGELAFSGAVSTRRNLVFGRSARILTMMQSYASAAKLRAAGPFSKAA